MMDNIPAMKMLQLQAFVGAWSGCQYNKADRVFKGVMLLACGQISKAEPSNAPTKYASNKVGFDFKGVIFQALGYNH